MDEQTKIVEINVQTNADGAREKLLNLKKELQENAAAIAALEKKMEEEGEENEDLARSLIDLQAKRKALTAEARKQEKEIVNEIAANRANVGSLDQMRAALAAVTKQYDELSQEERDGSAGEALKKQINEITTALKDAEGGTQRFQRNVGNYPSAFDASADALERFGGIVGKVFGANSPMAKAVQGFADFTKRAGEAGSAADAGGDAVRGMAGGMGAASTTTTTATTAVGGLTKGVKALGVQLLKLLANPIVLAIAAVVAAVAGMVATFKKVTDAIKQSDDAGTALEELLQVLKVPLKIVGQLLQALGHALTPVIEGVTKLATAVLSLIPAFERQVEAEKKAVRQLDEYQAANRRANRSIAEAEAEAAELMVKSRDREHYNLQERTAFLDEALKREKEIAAERKAIADRALRQRITEVARDKGISEQQLAAAVKSGKDLGNLTDEIKDDLNGLYIATVNAEKQYNDDIRRLTSQRSTFALEEKREREAAAKEAQEARKRAAAAEREILRQVEDATIAAIKEQSERERTTAKVAAQRKIADIQERLATEQDLTKKARAALAERVKQIEAKLHQDLADIDKRANEEKIRRAVEAETRAATARLAAAEKGRRDYADAVAVLERMAYKQESEALQRELEEERLTFEQFYEIDLANKIKHQKAIQDAEDSVKNRDLQEIKQRWQNRIDAEVAGSREQLQARLAAAKAERDALQKFNSETDDQFLSRQLAANAKVEAAQRDIVESDKQAAAARIECYNAIGGAVGALSQLMTTASQQNKELANIAKAVALGEVAINTGVAIAKGVKAASDVPFPGNIASIATTVATVLANMATALSAVNSAQFAKGGLVQGGGTETSDSIHARLSNGESVLTARATAAHYETLSRWNVEGGGVPFPETRPARRYARGGVVAAAGTAEARAMLDAITKVQPVVSVKEITTAQNKVKIKESKLNK